MAPPQGTRRWLYFAAGWLAFSLGVVGAVLPVVPTTPFMLVALWCFSRSSPRFSYWLENHRLFGPSLRRWKEHRIIPLYVKLTAYVSMATSLTYLIGYSNVWWPYVACAGLLMASGGIFIARCPSRIRPESAADAS